MAAGVLALLAGTNLVQPSPIISAHHFAGAANCGRKYHPFNFLSGAARSLIPQDRPRRKFTCTPGAKGRGWEYRSAGENIDQNPRGGMVCPSDGHRILAQYVALGSSESSETSAMCSAPLGHLDCVRLPQAERRLTGPPGPGAAGPAMAVTHCFGRAVTSSSTAPQKQASRYES